MKILWNVCFYAFISNEIENLPGEIDGLDSSHDVKVV